jgi:endonuclease/exonuclease/phosphatase family metal-dependent hydrolase
MALASTRPEPKEGPVQKTLFALLVAVVSIVGWQVIQKYKVEGLDVLASVKQRAGWNTSTSTYPPADPQQHPGLNGGYAQGPQQFPQQYPQQYPSQHPQQAQYPAQQFPQQPGYPALPQQYPPPQFPQQQPVQPIPYPTGYAPPYQNPPQNTGYYGQQPPSQVASYPPLAPLPTTVPSGQTGYPQQQPVLTPLPGVGNPPPQQYGQNGYGQPPVYGQQPVAQPQQPPVFGNQPPQHGAPAGTIKIASFNIQVFGESKLRKPDAMRTIVEVVRRFDVVAIQELRATSDEIMPRFIAELNATGRRYDFIVGPRLGRTNSKEQYVFVYDTATIECDRSSMYTAQNPGEKLHRAPLVASFRTRNAPPQQAFTFSLVNIHTDPDEVPLELAALADVIRAVRNDGRGEDDVLLLGDLNADERMLANLAQTTGSSLVVNGVPTNTRRTKTYDNILYARNATTEFTQQWGVLDFEREFRLTPEQALEVSDHFPVWAEYSVYEGGSAAQQQMVRTPVGMLDR